ncbi:MAG: FHA domain-containing protein [Armatimonadetes bacterium]|nr:FHA domain-containing protein [Anaerolineae bacterium]
MADSMLSAWLVELYFPKYEKSVKFRLETRIVIGRTDPENTVKPDIDLDSFGAEENGVSRQHLAFSTENSQLYVTDLQAGNGTLLNGVKLETNKAYPISHGNMLTLGRLEAQLRVVISPSHSSSIQGQQRSLQLQDQDQQGSGQLVMIVEDDDMVAKLLSLMLERAGYTVSASRSVSGAIRLFKQKPPAAIVLDLMLPDMNGLELCRYVRRDSSLNATPIIVVSAANTQENVENAMQAGADLFLGKPVSSRELRHVVSSLILHKEKGVASLHTKHLIGTAPLKAMEPKSRRDTLVMFVSGYNDLPITVNLRQATTLGRQATAVNTKNHVDLTRYDAVDLGVSRVHASLSYNSAGFCLEDNASVNGTYLNGEPVKAHTLTVLHNADEIRLGQLRLYVYFLTDEDLGS